MFTHTTRRSHPPPPSLASAFSLTSAAASGSNGPFARFRLPQLLERLPHPQAEPAAEGSGRDRSSSHTDNAFLRLKNASRVAALPAAGVTSGSASRTYHHIHVHAAAGGKTEGKRGVNVNVNGGGRRRWWLVVGGDGGG